MDVLKNFEKLTGKLLCVGICQDSDTGAFLLQNFSSETFAKTNNFIFSKSVALADLNKSENQSN